MNGGVECGEDAGGPLAAPVVAGDFVGVEFGDCAARAVRWCVHTREAASVTGRPFALCAGGRVFVRFRLIFMLRGRMVGVSEREAAFADSGDTPRRTAAVESRFGINRPDGGR